MVKVKLPSKNLMESLLDLCKHRGFLFPSAEIHGGLRGAYDYGPLGVELKKNLVSEWWNSTVYAHDNVVGLDTSILTPSAVLRASGHVDGFTDDLVGCKLSNERFRPDKAPGLEVRYVTQANGGKQMTAVINAGSDTTAETWKAAIASTFAPGSRVDVQGPEVVLYPLSVTEATTDRDAPFVPGKILLQGSTEDAAPVELPYHGYVSPKTNSFFLSESRPFNLMFKTFLDPIDPIERVIGETLRVAGEARTHAHAAEVRDQARTAVQGALHNSTVYLRPETAQGVFLNYLNCQRVSGLIPPFGIAQIGKSFRNEINLEHAIFRTPEFEQMELEYFVPPSQAPRHFNRWVPDRFKW